MLKKCKALIVGLVTMIAASTVQAETVYKCEFKNIKRGAWLPKIVYLVHLEKAGKAAVLDPYIMHYMNTEDPIPVKSVKAKGDELKFHWIMTGAISISGQLSGGFDFRVSFRKSDGRARIYSKPRRYPDQFRASGICAVEK